MRGEKKRKRKKKKEEKRIGEGLMLLEILHLAIQVHKLVIMFTKSKASTDSWAYTLQHPSPQDGQT